MPGVQRSILADSQRVELAALRTQIEASAFKG
jgi:hypothetical protein